MNKQRVTKQSLGRRPQRRLYFVDIKVDGKVGKKVTKKRFTKFSAKDLELAQDWFKNDAAGVPHLFAQGFTRRLRPDGQLLAN